MKKVLLIAMVILSCGMAKAQSVTIKAGTIVPLQAVSNLKGGQANEGQNVDFTVTKDITVDGVTVIPKGTIAKGTVTEAQKSTIAGTKGKLSIAVKGIDLPSGEPLYFTGTNIYLTGQNRTALSVILTCVGALPCILIPGSAAKLPAGYEVNATVASTTTVNVGGK